MLEIDRVKSGRSVMAVPEVCPLQPRLVDVEGAARYLGVSTWTVRDLEASGLLCSGTPAASGWPRASGSCCTTATISTASLTGRRSIPTCPALLSDLWFTYDIASVRPPTQEVPRTRRENIPRWSSTWPASTLERSSMSLIRARRWSAERGCHPGIRPVCRSPRRRASAAAPGRSRRSRSGASGAHGHAGQEGALVRGGDLESRVFSASSSSARLQLPRPLAATLDSSPT